MISTVRKSIALILSVMFVFFSLPGLPASALDDPGKAAFAENIPPDGQLPDLSGIREKKESQGKSLRKMDSQLQQLVDPSLLPEGKTRDGMLKQLKSMKMVTNGKDKAAGTPQTNVYVKLQPGADPEALGSLAKIKNKDLNNNLVVVTVDVDKLEALAELDAVLGVQMVTPPIIYGGSRMTEGDGMHRGELARTLGGVDGSGVKIGVISDGVDHLADAVATGDLPNNVTIVNNDLYHEPDYDPATHPEYDEGTAMLEIIYDMAPGAELFFSDCGEDWFAFNESIDDLVAAGCSVIVDDVGWVAQPFFEDGIIANHIEALVNSNTIVYVTAAGNAAQHHYQGKFYRNTNDTIKHDFSHGKDAQYKQLYISLDPGEYVWIVLEWDDYFGSSGNDYDLFLHDRTNMQIVAFSNIHQEGSGDDPLEFIDYKNETKTTLNLAINIENFSAEVDKKLELYMYPGPGVAFSVKNIVADNSIFGHAAVPGVLTCGAIKHSTPSTIEAFSSRGLVTMLGDAPSQPTYYRQKPDVCGADGVSVTGAGGFPSTFYGTSAAAPHVAAIAALVWSAHPDFTPQQVRDRILNNAVDLGTAGYDSTYGYGRADAYYSVLDTFYTVSFEENGGTACANQRIAENDMAAAPTITRPGATLVGWFVDADCTIPWDFGTAVTGDVTLYAKWEVAKYTVAFNSRGGSEVAPQANVEHGSKIAAPTAPTRTGYTFAGWCSNATCTTAWNFTTSTVTANITLYAKWIAAAPRNPKAKSLSYNSVRVSWDHSLAAPDIDGYEVWRATSATGTYALVSTVTGSTLAITNSGLATNAAYYYKIRAYDLAGSTKIFGSFSTVTAVVRPIPTAPATCVADSASYSSVKIKWGAVSGASGYEVYRAIYYSTGTYTRIVTTTATSYTNTGLSTGSAYYYKVRAYRTVNGVKVYGPFSVADVARPTLSIPPTVRAYRASSSSIKVTWGGVSGASGYELWRSTTASGGYVLVKATTARYYTNTKLTTGKWYYYKVRAYRILGKTKVYSAFSAYSAAKP